MNIYKLNYQEMNDLQDEFKKTNFGKRATVFAMFPILGFVTSAILGIADDIINGGNSLFIFFAFLNMSLFGIAQLQYGNMLKEYIQSKKEK